jgi:hypothetical protein
MTVSKKKSDKSCLLVTDLSHRLTVQKLPANDKVECYFCTTSTKLKDMCDHVGRHILAAVQGIEDSLPLKSGMQISINPCGWCGREGCKEQLTKKGNSVSISPSCPYHYSKIMYGKATQYSTTLPCTNVPIRCPICPTGLSGQSRTIWKYNALTYFAAEHVPVGSDSLPEIPSQFIVETFITSQEEKQMGIDQDVCNT